MNSQPTLALSLLLLPLLASLPTGCDASADAKPEPVATASAEAPSGRAVRVELATIEPTAAQLSIELPGEVEASRDAMLSAAMGGYVEKITVEAGDEVRKGQLLALVDSATQSARQAQAQVELDNAKREYERQKMLGRATPRAQLEAAESRYLAAKAGLRVARVTTTRSVIKAPFAGKIASVEAEVGETAGPGVPLMRLVKLDPIKVTVSVPGRDVVALKEGMKVKVGTDAGGTQLHGTLSLIQPAADVRTRTFIAEIEVEGAEDALLPGMIANVRIDSGVAHDQVVIAQDWLVTKPEALGVFVHEGGMAKWRPVKLGSIVRNQVVVQEGLKPGDELVITGHRELAEGDRLIIARHGTCCVDGRVTFGDATETPVPAPAASAEGPDKTASTDPKE